jgi:hypothetical protein
MVAGAVVEAFPSDRRERFRGRWAGRKAGSEEVASPCGIDGLRALSQENDLFRLSAKTQAFFSEIHLPLLPRLRQGKAFGRGSSYF